MIVAIEPWHGQQVVVYSPPKDNGLWQRHVIDSTLHEGHALAVADFDGDGVEEFVVGWRANGGGLRLYKASDAAGREFKAVDIDPAVPAEGAVVADINGDGKPDLVVRPAGQINFYGTRILPGHGQNSIRGKHSGGGDRETVGNHRNIVRPGIALGSRRGGSGRGQWRAAWLKAAKHGVFVHFLGGGPEWNQKVDSFDVRRFATQMVQARAGYVVFTLGQNSGYYCSPNATYDKFTGHRAGQRCSRRDLPMELADALQAQRIPLMLYLPSRAPQDDAEAMKSLADVRETKPARRSSLAAGRR